jgi:hypothetical protein
MMQDLGKTLKMGRWRMSEVQDFAGDSEVGLFLENIKPSSQASGGTPSQGFHLLSRPL